MSSPNIKLFVCCHRPVKVPADPLLIPIQVGAALAEGHFSGFLYDDDGDNISAQNRYYCELTAHYWAWKNVTADYYGFFHYRRYLYPSKNTKIPYIIKREPSLEILDKLGYDRFANLILNYDVIVPQKINMYMSVRKQYSNSTFHHYEDLCEVEKIIQRNYPNMLEALERYFSGTCSYFWNIYIMRRDIFFDYCSWLFAILKEFAEKININNRYNVQEERVLGYLSERLLGVFLTYWENKLRITELSSVHFYKEKYIQMKIKNSILPPGSLRRFVAKNLFNYF